MIFCMNSGKATLKLVPFVISANNTGIKIHFNLISRFNGAGCFRTFDDRKPYIDGIAIKDTGKGFRNHTAYAGGFDGNRSMLPGGATAKILFRNDNICLFSLS